MSAAPWDIYAEQLKNLQYGYPLWVPDPAPQLGPVQLGDVGWIRQGEFIPLFNAFRAAEDAQPWDSVPAQFMPLDTRSLSFFGPREKIGQTLLCSSSIKQREGSASVSAGNNTPSFPSADLAFSFRCRDDAGAVLLLSPSAMSYDVLGEGAIKDYIASNFDGWFRFATEVRQLPLREKDIRFVIGTTKSIRWAVAAFRGRYRNRDGALTGALGALPGSANLSFTISNQSLPSTHWRIGPPTRINGAQDNRGSARIEAAGSTAIETHDQCLFIHSVKAKRRIIPRFLKAGAGPHELPRNFKDPASRQTLSTGDWDDESASEDELSSAHDEPADPTDFLLDYILENSDATMAIASDLNLYELLQELPSWPEDVEAALLKLSPKITVSSTGVGTVCTSKEDKSDESGRHAEMTHKDHFSTALLDELASTVAQTQTVPAYELIKEHVRHALLSVLGSTEPVLHEFPNAPSEVQPTVPLKEAAEMLSRMWNTVNRGKVYSNTYLRLIDMCAIMLLAVQEEIADARSEVGGELQFPIARLVESFSKVHDVLVKQSKGPFLKQYLQRSVAPRALSSCQRSISNALSMFNSSLQIRVLRQVIASAEPALSTMIQPDSIAIEPQHMIETLYSVLESGQQSSLARDAEELRQRLLKANSNDASEVLSLLEVERDQVPEAIQTLQRALESETAPGHLTPVTTDEEYSLVDAPDDASASLLPSPLSRSAKSRQRSPSATQSTPDQTSFLASNATAQRNVLDREFLEMAIDSLRRSGGVETNLPKWTITRYEIDLEERIGRSEVYKGVWRGRAVAVKLMPKTTSKHMFLQLVSMWETLEHPNVLEFLGALSTSNDPPWFVVTPYYSNGSLVTYLHGLSSLESADTLGMIHNIAEGMAYLHNRDVLHGELRAENVLVDNRGRCIVTNFAQWEMKAEAYRLSRVLPPHDSLRWQAPELMYFESGVTRAADVYAFAITCFEILTKGALPWPEADDYTVRDFVLGNNMRPKLPLQQVWSTELATILHACWHRQPEVRPSFTRIEREVRELRARFGTSVREDFAPSEPPSASMLAISKSQSPLSAVPRLTSSVVSTNDRLPSLVLESDVNSSYTPQSLGNALVPSDEHGQDLRNERVYRMFLTHEFHSSLTLPLWTPSQIPVGAVGYHNKAGGGEFLVLFNATDPTQSSGGFARGIPRLSAFGRASQASERQDKRPVAQRGLDTVRSLFRGSPRGPPESRYARRYSAPLHAGRRSAHLFTESTVYRFIEDLATAKGWFKANVDRILALYGAEHRIVKEDLYLVTGTLEAKEYALFVSHDHPDGQVDFNVFEAPSRGHPWGEFTFSFDRKSTPLGEPQEDEQRSLTHAEKVSKCGDNRWLSLLLARLRFKPDQSEPTLL